MRTPLILHPAPEPLRPHQREAIGQALKVLADTARTNVLMPCGTGKTRVGAEVAHQIATARQGRRLVVVPTLDLVHQTVQEWAGHLGRPALGRIIAVCSDKEILNARRGHRHEPPAGTAVTVDPAHLAQLGTSAGPTTIACTYASLGVLAEAQARHGLPAPDIAVIDEAHRTAGPAAKAWATIHYDEVIAAHTRLYLTATPRVVTGDQDDMISMSDQRVYGPTAHQMSFATAIELGLLADYRLVVPVVTDAQVQALTRQADSYLKIGRTGVAASMLATQLAVLRAAREHGIRRMITFHSSVQGAKWFSTLLPHAYALLSPDVRPPGLWSDFVHGDQHPAVRRRAVDRLRADDGGELGVISCARVLTEGVDIPAVDAVVFLDRKSVIETIQGSGRALRRGDPRRPKTASIIVPVVLGPGEDPETALASSTFAPVWQTVRALASHDDRLAAQLESGRRGLAEPRPRTGPAGVLPDWLSLTDIPVPEGFAEAVTTQTVRMATSSWPEYHRAAELYLAEYGDLLVPYDHVTSTGLRLGTWIVNLRIRYRKGDLTEHQIQEMNRLGMVWSNTDRKLKLLIKEIREFKRAYGHLRIPRDYVARRPDGTTYNLGEIATTLRWEYKAKRHLSAAKIAAVTAEGFIWEARETYSWDQFISDLLHFRREYGHLDVPTKYTIDGRKLGAKSAKFRSTPSRLTERKRKKLDEIGFIWDPFQHRFNLRITHLEKYKAEFGHVLVPASYVTDAPSSIRLGQWLHSCITRFRQGKLPHTHAQRLRALGVDLDSRRDAQ